jgi:predicted regulator of Ras-like GTPase activity (Roadblock/LC7/MglB family)
MANVKETLNAATSSIDGAMAAALVDYESGMALGMAGSGVDLELAAAGNTEVVRAKMRTMDMLGIKGEIEDILITLQSQYHIIYIVPDRSLFLYLVLAKDKANLAMARYKLKSLVAALSIN